MSFEKLTKKQLRGESFVPMRITITQIDFLHEGRRSDGNFKRATVHGPTKYTRKSKHKGKED